MHASILMAQSTPLSMLLRAPQTLPRRMTVTKREGQNCTLQWHIQFHIDQNYQSQRLCIQTVRGAKTSCNFAPTSARYNLQLHCNRRHTMQTQLRLQPRLAARSGLCNLGQVCRPSAAASALKRPSQLLPPEDKALQCVVETGIRCDRSQAHCSFPGALWPLPPLTAAAACCHHSRGSLAMLAVTALQLDLFSHIHWSPSDVLSGLQLAVPCAAVDAALLAVYTTLSGPRAQQQQSSSSGSSSSPSQQADQAAAKSAVLAAVDSVYLHNIRYSLIGAATPAARAALEAASQLSEELLARGALLGCASAWLTNRWVGLVCLLACLRPWWTTPAAATADTGVDERQHKPALQGHKGALAVLSAANSSSSACITTSTHRTLGALCGPCPPSNFHHLFHARRSCCGPFSA